MQHIHISDLGDDSTRRDAKDFGRRPSKHVSAALSAIVCLLVALALSGCTQEKQPLEEEKQITPSEYMVKLEQAATNLQNDLEAFATAASDNDIAGMQAKAETAYASIDAMKEVEVPDSLKELQQKYVDACESLESTLDEYISLYIDFSNPNAADKADFSSYTQRLEEIQKHYDDGLTALEEADKLASEM